MNLDHSFSHIEKIIVQERKSILKVASSDLRALLKKIPVSVSLGDGSLYGDYSGTPYPHESPFAPFSYPSNIIIYTSAFQNVYNDEQKLRKKIHKVLIHEYGHYLGLSDKELKEKGLY